MQAQSAHIDQLSQEVVNSLSLRKDIAAVYLFGSIVSGPCTAESDADIAVLFLEKVEKGELLSLQQALSDQLGMQADLVDLAVAPVILRMQVFRKGKKLFDRNPSVTTSLIVRTLFEYDDLKRIIKPIEDSILRGRIYG
ncbi:MAG: putative nucleotidyltransferase [Bacteroidetes bacterium]|nr:putative nucleotidyltransferase [Bacteroidota bacterium]